MIFDNHKKIELFPTGGLVEEVINPVLKPNEAREAFNLSYKGRLGGIIKSPAKDTIITRRFPDESYDALWLFSIPGRYGLRLPGVSVGVNDVIKVSSKFNDGGIEHTNFAIAAIARWEDWILATGYDPGNYIIDDWLFDPIEYEHIYSRESTPDIKQKEYYRYGFIISRGNIADTEDTPNKIFLRHDHPDESIVDYVYQLKIPNIKTSRITLESVIRQYGAIEPGKYAYQFLWEDFAGNVAGAFTDVEESWEEEGHGYVNVPFIEKAVKISINITGFQSQMRYLYIFRSETNFDRFGPGEPVYYLVKKIDCLAENFRNINNFVYYDITANLFVTQNDVYTAKFDFGLNPRDIFAPETATCGVIHQRVLFLAEKNKINYSFVNHFRTFKENEYSIIPEANEIVAMNSNKDRLEIFADNGIWIWYGRSDAERTLNRPRFVSAVGIPYYDIRKNQWNRTVVSYGDKTFFVDSDGYPRQLIGENVYYLSLDGDKKNKITGDKINAVIVGDEYRITNGDEQWICHLENGYAWSKRDNAPYSDQPQYLHQSGSVQYDGRYDSENETFSNLWLDNKGNLSSTEFPIVSQDGQNNMTYQYGFLSEVPGTERMNIGGILGLRLGYMIHAAGQEGDPSDEDEHVLSVEIFVDEEIGAIKTEDWTYRVERWAEQRYMDIMLKVVCRSISIRFSQNRLRRNKGGLFEWNYLALIPTNQG